MHKGCSSTLKIVEKGIMIQFLWCPAHMGWWVIKKQIIMPKRQHKVWFLHLPQNHINRLVRWLEGFAKLFFEEMRGNSSNRVLTQKKKPSFDMENYCRLIQKYGCLMFHFQSTHVGIKHRLFIIGKAKSPQCDDCSEIESIVHYVVECKECENLRKEMIKLYKEENLGELSVGLALGILVDGETLKYTMIELFCKRS